MNLHLRISLTAVAVALMFFAGALSLVQAAAPDAPVVQLWAGPQEAVVGEEVTWLALIALPEGMPETQAVIAPADVAIWAGATVTATVEGGQTTLVALRVRPQVAGRLRPAAQVTYGDGDATQITLFESAETITARALADAVSAEAVVAGGTVTTGGRWTVAVIVRNDSPWTLQDVAVVGEGEGVAWETANPVNTAVPARGQAIIRVSAQAQTRDAQPRLMLSYRPETAPAGSEPQIAPVPLTAPEVRDSAWRTLLDSSGQIVLGALVGAVASLAAFFAQRRSDTRQRRATEWRQAQSLLRGALAQTRYAANTFQSADMAPISKAHYEMFEAVDRQELTDEVARVYRATVTYNDGRQQPGGAQRQQDLLAALDQLAQRLTAGEKRRWWRKR